MTNTAPAFFARQFALAGDQVVFMGGFFRNIFRSGFEWNEFLRQCYIIGFKSFSLVGITGFILGFVLTLQSEPTMKAFGAESYVPSMVAISVIREIGPTKPMANPKNSVLITAGIRSAKLSEENALLKYNVHVSLLLILEAT